MNPASLKDYDGWKRDDEAIQRDAQHGNPGGSPLSRDLPWVIYREGKHRGNFRTFEAACRYAQERLGIMGRCTIRDAFAPPPAIPLLVVENKPLIEAARALVAKLDDAQDQAARYIPRVHGQVVFSVPWREELESLRAALGAGPIEEAVKND